jgi:acyl-coenzyme A thioesterase PaaI-like protein
MDGHYLGACPRMIDKKKDFTELLQGFRDIYENQVPFNRILGLKLESLTENDVCIKFKMKDELVGNYVDGVLHGGVISAVLDTVGALTASVGILKGKLIR